jgi:predicted nuclease of predicted toxin-antitoxin system
VRFLANENFPGDAVNAIRAAGHDLAWVRTDAPGSLDPGVLALAVRENRVLLTFDKDFGELAWRAGLPASSGIVLFRLPMPSPTDVGPAIASIIDSRGDWAGHFSVVEPDRVRMRPLSSRS